MIKAKSVLFARVADPSPRPNVVSDAITAAVLIKLGKHAGSAVHQSLETLNVTVYNYSCTSEIPGNIQTDIIFVSEDGYTSMVDLNIIGDEISIRFPRKPIVLVSNRHEDRQLAETLIGNFDAILGYPLSDENFEYTVKRCLSNRSNFPMRHFDSLGTNTEHNYPSGWWIVPMFIMAIGVWVFLGGIII